MKVWSIYKLQFYFYFSYEELNIPDVGGDADAHDDNYIAPADDAPSDDDSGDDGEDDAGNVGGNGRVGNHHGRARANGYGRGRGGRHDQVSGQGGGHRHVPGGGRGRGRDQAAVGPSKSYGDPDVGNEIQTFKPTAQLG